MVQYWFDGPVVEIKAKPHGNSHSSKPFFRTAQTAKAYHKEIAQKNTPKAALHIAAKEKGGELTIKSLNSLPRMQQLKNYRRSGKNKDSDVLYSVMLQCKVCEGKEECFVRDVKAARDPQCVLFTDWQLTVLELFTTDSQEHSIVSVDTTYNLGEFYVTPMVYEHRMLEDTFVYGTCTHPPKKLFR